MPFQSNFAATGRASHRADGPSRREVLVAAALLAAPLPALAQQTAAPLDDAGVLALVRAATGHSEVTATTAARLYAALRAADAAFPAHAAALAALPEAASGPEALLRAADAAGLKAALLAIVAAAYTGTVGDGPDAVVIAYADALMFQPTRDAAPVPTYCGNGPAWWTAAPPALGVSVDGQG